MDEFSSAFVIFRPIGVDANEICPLIAGGVIGLLINSYRTSPRPRGQRARVAGEAAAEAADLPQVVQVLRPAADDQSVSGH